MLFYREDRKTCGHTEKLAVVHVPVVLPQVEWVPGKTNPVDLSSRADFIVNPVTSLFVLDTSDFTDKDRTVKHKLHAVHFPMVLPQVIS